MPTAADDAPWVGRAAPNFDLPDQDGRRVRLQQLVAQAPLVLYFYPKDQTPGCTKQACAFRDAFARIAEAKGQVVGVSRDTAASHRAFRQRHQLPFVLLCDEDGAVHQSYGVKNTLGFLRGRETFVIDQQGIMRHAFRSQFSIDAHVQGALAALAELGVRN